LNRRRVQGGKRWRKKIAGKRGAKEGRVTPPREKGTWQMQGGISRIKKNGREGKRKKGGKEGTNCRGLGIGGGEFPKAVEKGKTSSEPKQGRSRCQRG